MIKLSSCLCIREKFAISFFLQKVFPKKRLDFLIKKIIIKKILYLYYFLMTTTKPTIPENYIPEILDTYANSLEKN
jgi:hypothetical protein